MTHDLYFMILVEVFTIHIILTENTYFTNLIEWTEHKIMVLKPRNKYIIEIVFSVNFHFIIVIPEQK